MSEFRIRSANERRTEIQARANNLGIDEAFISNLVETFYSAVRANPEIGPIFEAEIGDDWPPHLATMKKFWSSVALNSGNYSGRPMPVHMRLKHVGPQHFVTWLKLFEKTLNDLSSNPETVRYFMERANRIARSFQMAMFETPKSILENAPPK